MWRIVFLLRTASPVVKPAAEFVCLWQRGNFQCLNILIYHNNMPLRKSCAVACQARECSCGAKAPKLTLHGYALGLIVGDL